jgi:hypothetical protein
LGSTVAARTSRSMRIAARMGQIVRISAYQAASLLKVPSQPHFAGKSKGEMTSRLGAASSR